MKLYISADMEGSAGLTVESEYTPGHPDYAFFRAQMSREVAAACRGAVRAGAGDILVRDAHYDARNLDPTDFPECARLLRGHTGDCFPMVSGLQLEHFDACLFTGYHSGVTSPEYPLSHTFSRHSYDDLRLNGTSCSEFRFYAYACAELGVPVAFLSGDAGICAEARRLVPGITTVATHEGRGAATISLQPQRAAALIEEGVAHAVARGFGDCYVELPKHFTLEIRFRDHQDAYARSFYPGARLADSKTVVFESDRFEDIRVAVHFIA